MHINIVLGLANAKNPLSLFHIERCVMKSTKPFNVTPQNTTASTEMQKFNTEIIEKSK